MEHRDGSRYHPLWVAQKVRHGQAELVQPYAGPNTEHSNLLPIAFSRSAAVRLRRSNRRWRYDDLYKSGRDVVDEAGNKPLARQCRNRPERSNVHGDRRAGIGDRFGLEFLDLYLKVARQQGWVLGEARHAAIGVLK